MTCAATTPTHCRWAKDPGSVIIIDQETFAVEVSTVDGAVEADGDGLFAIPGLDVLRNWLAGTLDDPSPLPDYSFV